MDIVADASLVESRESRAERTDRPVTSEPKQRWTNNLVKAYGEIDFDWPKFLSIERIKAGIVEVALLCYTVLVVTFCRFQ